MANLTTNSPLSRRIARSFLQFLNSVEPSAGVDGEALDVVKECIAEVFRIDPLSLDNNTDSLVDIFTSRDAIAGQNESTSDAQNSSLGKNVEDVEDQDRSTGLHFPGGDEIFGQLFGALDKMHYFRRTPDGNDDQAQLDRVTHLFHKAVEEIQISGCQEFDQKLLAETFKSQGNKDMQSKRYAEAIELYTFAIALCENNAVYYCNRAAAYTQIRQYSEAVQDCLKSIEINPNYSKAYSRLGFAYYSQGKYREAIERGYMKALLLDPNNESVKENIRVAEQKLKDEQHRAATGQSSTSTSQEPFNHQYRGGPRSNSGASFPRPGTVPVEHFNNLPADLANMFMNISGQHSGASVNEQNEAGSDNEPGIGFGGNINININGNGNDPTSSVPFDINNIANMVRNASGQHFGNQPGGQSQAGAHTEPGTGFSGNININGNEQPVDISDAIRSMMSMFSGAGNQQQQNDGNQRPNAS